MHLFRCARRSIAGVVVAVLAALVVGGCSAPAGSTAATTVAIADAWVRPAVAGGASAAYLTIRNTGTTPDALIAVHCRIAGSVMIHQTTTDASGMTGMSMVESLPLPAGGTVTLAPGGAHVMMSDLTRPISAGEKIELELVFQHAGTIRIAAVARAS